MTRTLSLEELAEEADVSRERIDWMSSIGILEPREPGTFRFGDVFRVKMVAALLKGGFTSQQIEWVVSEGHLNLDRIDEYLPFEPGPRSDRTFSEFLTSAGPRASLLPAVYVALGLPEPDPSSPIHIDEEERFRRFLEGWSLASSDETLIRAARLIAEGTRVATLGWAELLDEQIAGPARERLYRGEVERFPDEVRLAFSTLVGLQPLMMQWLIQRYLEQRSVAGIVEGFEEFFAARGLAAPVQPSAPPAVVFVDLSGYTRLTEEHGDEVAVRLAATLQQRAETVAAANGGRLVKLLGDGAMLSFPDAQVGAEAAVALVRALGADGSTSAHAGVHTGPVIERDLDLFGRTVNLASRIADVAGPGEILVSDAVVQGVADNTELRFQQAEEVVLKGVAEPVRLFRVTMNRG